MSSLPARTAAAATVYVDSSMGSSGDGASWATAKKTVQEGINIAGPANEVHVATGTYWESVTLTTSALVYGGYPTGGGVRDVAAHETIINGSAARGGLPAYHVVTLLPSTRLDGFTVTGGAATGGDGQNMGGGIYCAYCDSSTVIANCRITGNSGLWAGGVSLYACQATLTSCTITNNSAVNDGGGIEVAGNAFPLIAGCVISKNTAGGGGGGVCWNDSWSTFTGCVVTENSASGPGGGLLSHGSRAPYIADCAITGNLANSGGGMSLRTGSPSDVMNCAITDNSAGNGGGVDCMGSSPTITQCDITANYAGMVGGGVYCYNNASPTITDCRISGNSAQSAGGGVRCDQSSPTITHCTISGNSAAYAGGVYCSTNSSPTITNCTISGNSAPGRGGGVFCGSNSSPTITDCWISGNSALNGNGGGVLCVNTSSPAITNCAISGNSAAYGGGVLCGSNSSPTIRNCWISGNYSVGNGGGVNCDYGSPTIANCTISGNSAGGRGGGVFRRFSSSTIMHSLFFNNQPNDYFDLDHNLSYTGALAINANVFGAHDNVDGDPLFMMDGPKGIRGAWTAAPVLGPLTTRTLLTDSNAQFTPGALVGRFINTDTGQNLQSCITSNTLTQIEVFGDVTGFAASGDSYKVIDYHLREGSPCIGKGDNNAPGLTATDMDGDPRIVFDTVDIGADEFDPPPYVTEAVCNDDNNNGLIEPGESLTLVMNRNVLLTNPSSASNFYLPVSGDSLGATGFGVQLSPQNPRHIVITLGAGANLTVGGAFDMAHLTAGSPSGVDIAANLTSGTILSLTGKNAVDGGVEGVNDSGRDVFFTCVAKSTSLGVGGGTAQVQVSPNAAYTQHALIIPAGALGADQTITLRPPENNGGVLGAVQIDVLGGGGGGGGGIKAKVEKQGTGTNATKISEDSAQRQAKACTLNVQSTGFSLQSESFAPRPFALVLAPFGTSTGGYSLGGKPGTGTGGYSLGGKPGTGTGGYSLAGASPRFSRAVSVSSVSSVVENLPTLSQAGTPALPSQAGTPVLPSQAGTPAPLSEFAVPVELEIEYRESDVDREQGEVEAAMEVHQLVENPAGVFTWKPIPGDHHVDPAKNTVKVAVTDLNPCGSVGSVRVFAVIPGYTIEPVKTHVRYQPGAGVVIHAGPISRSGAGVSPGAKGDYCLHRIEIPNYVTTTEDDPERITLTVSQPALLHRLSAAGASFPVASSALFVVTARDAGDAPVAFTSPVNVRVQFMNGTVNKYNDLVDFHGASGEAWKMRVVRDTCAGPGVDFAFLAAGSTRQTVNTTAGTVEAFGVTGLTDSTGEGVWGAVVDSGIQPAGARCWEIYE